jgi:hypothetical protein
MHAHPVQSRDKTALPKNDSPQPGPAAAWDGVGHFDPVYGQLDDWRLSKIATIVSVLPGIPHVWVSHTGRGNRVSLDETPQLILGNLCRDYIEAGAPARPHYLALSVGLDAPSRIGDAHSAREPARWALFYAVESITTEADDTADKCCGPQDDRWPISLPVSLSRDQELECGMLPARADTNAAATRIAARLDCALSHLAREWVAPGARDVLGHYRFDTILVTSDTVDRVAADIRESLANPACARRVVLAGQPCGDNVDALCLSYRIETTTPT